MVIKPSEYRKKNVSVVDVTLKSGDVWKIRKMPFETLAKFFSILGISIDSKQSQESLKALFSEKTAESDFIKKIVELAKILLPDCCVEPEVTLSSTPTESQLIFTELEYTDIFELFFDIMDISGFSAEEMTKRESFQQKSIGKVDKADSIDNAPTTQ